MTVVWHWRSRNVARTKTGGAVEAVGVVIWWFDWVFKHSYNITGMIIPYNIMDDL